MYPDARCPQRLGQYSDLAVDLAPPAIQGHLEKLSPGNFVLVGDGSVDRAQLWFCPDHAFKAVVSDGTGAYGSIEQELYIHTATHMLVLARLATHILCTAAAEPLLTLQLVNEHLPGQMLLHITAETVCISVLAELETNAALLCQLETAGGGRLCAGPYRVARH